MPGICGALTKAGLPCRAAAMGNGFCCWHGGAKAAECVDDDADALAADAGAGGLYALLLAEDERAFYEAARARAVTLDEEIALAQVRLRRYVLAAEATGDAVDADEPVGDQRERRARAKEYAELIIKMLDLIRRLGLARQQLLKAQQVGVAVDIGRVEMVIAPDEEMPGLPVL